MQKSRMKHINKIIQQSDINGLYDYAWLIHNLMDLLGCEYYYADARVEHNGFSLWEVENRWI